MIAGILEHELAHYYLKHSLKTFLEGEAGAFDQGIFRANTAFGRYSVKNELQADSLAMRWLKNSGYNIEGLIRAFEKNNQLEKNELKKSKDQWTLQETTHPLSEKRLEQLRNFFDIHKIDPGKNFLVDESKFNMFKEEAKPEILADLLKSFDYYSCIEKAFQFHIFDPDNTTYIYYLMESIRRNCYLDVELWGKMFITNRYYQTIMLSGRRHKEEMKDHLFKNFDLDIITIDPGEGVKIKAKFYWKGVPKFTTYEEAFNFFYNISQALDCKECILSNALSFTNDTTNRNKFLTTYLSFNEIKYRAFSENLMGGTILKKLPKQKLEVFDNFDITFRKGKDNVRLYLSPLNETNDLSLIFDSVMFGHKNITPVFLPTFKNTNFGDYRMLLELEKFSFLLTKSKGEKAELHILDPDMWNFFSKYNVNEIEFINCRYMELHSKEKSFENFKKFINMNNHSVFSQTQSTRFLESYISCVREIEDGVMKLRHYSGEIKLRSNESTSKQIISNLNYDLEINEKNLLERDIKNKKNIGKLKSTGD